MLLFALLSLVTAFKFHPTSLARRVKPGLWSPYQTRHDPQPRPPRMAAWLAHWRRLLLRLLEYVDLLARQCLMEVVRTPQLRGVRRLQRQREDLEKKALALAQAEQKMLAEAASASTVQPGTTLTLSRREDRVRPLSCIMGKGKYLVPCLEDSTHCRHLKTQHGANKNMSYQKCLNCGQEQQMPLTPVNQMETWNNTLVYASHDFYQKKKVKEEKAESVKAESTRSSTQGYRKPAAKSSAKATAAKTMPQKKSPIPEFSSDPEELEEDLEMDDEWEEINPIGPQDIAMSSMENDVLAQHCGFCNNGSLLLHRHQTTGQLLWRCMNPTCRRAWNHLRGHTKPAVGTFLCPQCNSGEMMTAPAMDGDAQHTELICLNTNCSLAIYLYQLPDYYIRMGQFEIENINK